jgi:hypothetical protein
MSNPSQTLIFTNLVFTNCPIPICDDILSKLLGRQCNKHGKIEYCNVIGSKNIGFVKFQLINDAIFVKNLMNNQLLFKSIVNIDFLDNEPIKIQRFFNPLRIENGVSNTEPIKIQRFFKPLRIENGISKTEPIKIQKFFTPIENRDTKTQQRNRIGKMLEDLLKN